MAPLDARLMKEEPWPGRAKPPASSGRSASTSASPWRSLSTCVAQAAAAGLAPHDFVRQRVLGFHVAPAKSPADAALISELNRVGVNLNQLARAVNTDRRYPGDWRALAEACTRLLARYRPDWRR